MSPSETSITLYLVIHGHSEKPGEGFDFSRRVKCANNRDVLYIVQKKLIAPAT